MRNKIILLAFLMGGIAFAKAQSYKDTISKDFTNYLDTIEVRDFEKSAEFMDEVLFEAIPKEQLITMMESAFTTPGVTIEAFDMTMGSVGDKMEINGNSYAILDYETKMKMKFEDPDDKDLTAEERAMTNGMIAGTLAMTFGKENVSLDEETNFFTIHAEKKAVAIKKSGFDRWKFLNVEENQRVIMEKLLPEKIIEKIFP